MLLEPAPFKFLVAVSSAILISTFINNSYRGCCRSSCHSVIAWIPTTLRHHSVHSPSTITAYRSNVPIILTNRLTYSVSGSTKYSTAKQQQRQRREFLIVSMSSLVSSSAAPSLSSIQRKSLRQVLLNVSSTTTLKQEQEKKNHNDKNIQVVGHRGAIYQYLENTIESFLYCTSDVCQCHAVELDVFQVKDGTLVVFHGNDKNPNIPGSLEGYCDPENNNKQHQLLFQSDGITYRSIMDLTYDEIQQLHFNPNYEEFVCPREIIMQAKVPTLQDVLHQLSKTDLQEIKIELKGPGTVQPVLELVEAMQLVSKCSYSSFDHDQLLKLRTLRPNKELYRTGALFNAMTDDTDNDDDTMIQRATECGATAIHLRYDDCTMQRIQTIHHHNFVSMAWFRGPMGMKYDATYRFHDIGGGGTGSDPDSIIENEACYRTLLDTGVQQICCNRPDLLMKILTKQL